MRRILASLFPLLLLLNACLPASGSIQPNEQPYVIITAPAQASPTAFQPGGSLPTQANLHALTAAPATEFVQPPTLTLTASPTLTPPPTETPTLPPTTTSQPAASGDRPQYAINAYWDYTGKIITVSQVILYPNRTGETLNSLLLAVNPNLWRGVFSLNGVDVDDSAWSNYTLQGQRLEITLPAPLQNGQAVKIGLSYNLALPYSSGKYENFGYTNRQTNLIDWYPFVPPYFPGEGFILREPFTYGENLSYPLADFQVALTFADPANMPVVAASAPGIQEGATITYNFPRARTFAVSASPEFQVRSYVENGVTYLSYYFPEHAAAGQAALDVTASAARTFGSLFGPYQHTSLSVVETDLNDGLESDGLFFLTRNFYNAYDGTPGNNLTLIGAHEVAHQWFYGAISSDQAREPWLDEALCTYAELLYYENNYPGYVNWWWNARIRFYSPTGWVDTRLYNSGNFRAYVNAVYLRGALFFHDLRLRMGDAAFFAFLRDYYNRHNGYLSTADTFFTVLADHTSSAEDLIQSYFYYR